jgi:hypothetical protein
MTNNIEVKVPVVLMMPAEVLGRESSFMMKASIINEMGKM